MAIDPLKSLDSYLTNNTFKMPVLGKGKIAPATQYDSPTATAPVLTPTPVPNSKLVGPISNKGPMDFSNDTNFSTLLNYLKTQNTPITSSVLAGNGTPIVPPAENNNKAGSALGIYGATGVEGATKKDKSESDTIRENLTGLYAKQGKEGEKTLSLQEQQKIDDKTRALNEADKNILITSRAYEKQLRELALNAEGQSTGHLSAAKSQITKQRDEHLADLSIIKAVALGDLDTANSIVAAKIKAEFEPINNQITTLEKMYGMYQNDMTESEKFDAQNAIDAAKTKAADFANAKKDAYQTAVAAGAPASVLQAIGAATTSDEAYAAIQGYGTSQLEKLQMQELQQKITASAPGTIAATQQSAVLEKLGLVDTIINSPYLDQVFGAKNPFTYWTPGSNEQQVKNQVSQLISQLSIEARAQMKGSGAISDFEAKTLARSVTSLGTNLGDKSARVELAKVRGALATANGMTATVEIVNPNTNERLVIQSNREGINNAIADGMLVEYK
jgi:hypothetical protein